MPDSEARSAPPASAARARVAVLTRTKDRPDFMRRAFASVRGQTLAQDRFVWAVYNDGGDPAPVDAIADEARAAGLNVLVRHNTVNAGVSAGLNLLLDTVDNPYYCVHDDDDTWEPPFLERVSDWLDARPDAAAVCTQATYVEEHHRNGAFKIVRRSPFNPTLVAHVAAELMRRNSSPPISMCFRRSAVDAVGGYGKDLPAMEDWDLMIRLVLRWEIGVIPERLANYHIRLRQRGSGGNTIHAGWRMHAAAESQIRNRYLREDLEAGRAGLGFLLAMGHQTKGVEELDHFRLAHSRLRGWPLYRWLRRLVGGRKRD